MGKQNNFRLSKTKNNILYILSGASLALFAGLVLFPTISESTHAEGDEPDDGITITVNGEVSANLVLFDEGDYKIAKDTVSVSSSAAYGYELFLTTDSEAHQSIYLNDDPTSESRIAPVSGTIAEPAILTDNTWGFAIAGQGNFDNEYDPANPDPASRFAIIPTVDEQQAVFENNAATAEDNIDFYYGIKVEPTLEVGEYTTSAEYTAIAKIPPLTAKAILGDNKNLNFVYDRNIYTIGETYTDNISNTKISAVYDVPMNSGENNQPGWTNYGNIRTVNFDDCFHDFKPTSTAFWFYRDSYLSTITKATNLDTSNVTDMSYMFYYAGYYASVVNLNLNGWDTSNVTNTSHMFYYAGYYDTTTFNLNLSDWNTGHITDMSDMFEYSGHRKATTWTAGDLGGWDTSNVIDMIRMFLHAGSTKATTWTVGDLSGWDTGNVTNMSYMFSSAGYNATTWNIGDLSGWNTSNVTDMSGMFYGAGYKTTNWTVGNLGYIDNDHRGWDTSNVTNMSGMFDYAGYSDPTFSLDLSGWKTSSVTNMSGMFAYAGYNATAFNLNLSGWDTSNVKNMSRMFSYVGYKVPNFNLSLGNLNTSSVTDMSQMFSYAGYSATTWTIDGISGWNTSNVTDMSTMFMNAGYSATVNWTVGNLGYVDDDHRGWDTSNVTNMGSMFNRAGYKVTTTWTVGDLSSWNTGNVTNVKYMFYDAGYNATSWDIGDIHNWNVSKMSIRTDFIDKSQSNIDTAKLPW